ncbi:MAG: MFS transporter [Muribaculaceae bacterium]|nr:MFS transporter [Muribaculaceae bacterium]
MDNNSKTYLMSDMPLRAGHFRVLLTASLGQLIGTALATTVGVVIPLMQIVAHPELSAAMQGIIGAADLVGIAVGSAVLGPVADRYGYLAVFRACPAAMIAAALAAIFFPSLPVLIISLFVMGFAIGGEYSLDSGYVSEIMPVRWRSTMVGVAKAGSAIGNIIAAGLCFLVLRGGLEAGRWPELMWIVAGIAAVMLLSRIDFAQSPLWLLERGRTAMAEKAAEKLLGPDVRVTEAAVPAADRQQQAAMGTWQFVRSYFGRVVLSGIPWACEGLGVYGIGVFLPVLVAALGLEHFTPGMAPLLHVTKSVEITLWISCIILPGFILGLLLLRRAGKVGLQAWGFFLSCLSLLVLLVSFELRWSAWITIGAFMAFELFLNMGPHLVTYVLPAAIYPVEVRAQGAGIAACIGKVGAVLGVFFMPMLLHAGGMRLVLTVSAAVMLAGGLVTAIVGRRVERAGGNNTAVEK